MGEKGAKTRERIRAAAYRLFAEKGFKEVTMTDICGETGLSRGGLYRYYGGTEEIFSELLSEEYRIRERIGRKESAAAILEDMLESVRSEILAKENSLSLAIYEYANLGNEAVFIRIHEKAKKRWMELIRYGMETKEFRETDPDMVSNMILYYYQGLRMWSRVIPFDARVAEYYAETVREALTGKRKCEDLGGNYDF
ncbi:MAG: TetR/AcrR family transcriptional regulator [Lachnospiraceae bacterium]|nr:TetR/AcrR family transcriptional regulator [Lachnospiraceae bacterium]